MIAPIVKRGLKIRAGKGFSILELKEAGISAGEAKHLSIPFDPRRNTSYTENVEALTKWSKQAKDYGYRVSKPKHKSKGVRGRAYRGLTSSGKKMRAL
jgi:large subunit ribosomal protein L13e